MFSISNTFTFHGRKTVSPWSPFTFEADEFSRSFGPIQADWNAWNSKPHKKGRNVSGITEYWRQYGAIGEGRPVKKHEKELQAPPSPVNTTEDGSIFSYVSEDLEVASPQPRCSVPPPVLLTPSPASTIPAVAAPVQWSRVSLTQQEIEEKIWAEKERARQAKREEEKVARKYDHVKGVFLNEPAGQYASNNAHRLGNPQYDAVGAHFGSQGETSASGLVRSPESCAELHQSLRPDANPFVPGQLSRKGKEVRIGRSVDV